MTKINTLFLIIVLFVACQNTHYKDLSSVEKTKQKLVSNYTLFAQNVKRLDSLVQHKSENETIRNQFKKARLDYKRIESLVSFYFPEATKNINGAAIDKNDIEDSNRKTEYATGFQKVEELVFSEEIDLEALQQQVGILNGFSQSLQNPITTLQLTDSNIFEAQKLQMVRMMSLGISGFDSPVALHSIPEARATMQSIYETIVFFEDDAQWSTLLQKMMAYLDENQNFDGFDRAEFIVSYCIPVSNQIYAIQQKLKIKTNPYTAAINLDEPHIFGKRGYNPDFFAPAYNRKPSKAQIELGKQLFFDPILSGSNTVSCATCHIPDQAYANHTPKAIVGNTSSRNVPTLLNSAYQNTQFLDGRVTYLEDQAKAVINNKDEMHGSFGDALKKVKNSHSYQQEFRKVFRSDQEITEQHLLKALASYVRSLSELNSKFDHYLRGEAKLTTHEKKGFNLYMGKAKCATCHFFPVFNGSVPPFYSDTESEVLGVPMQNSIENAIIDSDLGEYLITQAPLKKHAFKTPTVRNSALTFPYMHNGVYQTLEEVIDFYNRGGGAGIGILVENQTLPADQLGLSTNEIQDLIAFIKTLNTPVQKMAY